MGNQSVKLSSVLLALIKQMKPIKVKQLTSSNNCRLGLSSYLETDKHYVIKI